MFPIPVTLYYLCYNHLRVAPRGGTLGMSAGAAQAAIVSLVPGIPGLGTRLVDTYIVDELTTARRVECNH